MKIVKKYFLINVMFFIVFKWIGLFGWILQSSPSQISLGFDGKKWKIYLLKIYDI